MSDNDKVQIKNLTKGFKIKENEKLLVLDDITPSVKEGEFYSLLGQVAVIRQPFYELRLH